MQESVIFCLVCNGTILCEWRQYKGRYQHCLPGGIIDGVDRNQASPVLAACPSG